MDADPKRPSLRRQTPIVAMGVLVLLWVGCGQMREGDPALASEVPQQIDFNFHVRPILADRCYKCHGPDDNTREADLRLDQESSAFAKLESGKRAIARGSLRRSEAWQRIVSADAEYQMPPPESHLELSAAEKAIIAKWIEDGAEWEEHWAFSKPVKPQVPELERANVENEIDGFIQKKLEEIGLPVSDLASKERLVHRVTLDLTGLPPTLQEVDDFIRDTSRSAYETLVDALLSRPTHAERLTLNWLDIARYGDTQGLHQDVERRYWPWRDWVIEAFDDNMPFDDFLTWQMAGDLLPNPTKNQRLATAFHRLHPISSEGGIPDEEFRQKYVQDRTNTTATAFLGLTLECATCHDHKFDPISQKEYYQMTAFFDNIDELGLVNEASLDDGNVKTKHASGPVMLLPDSSQARELSALEQSLSQVLEERASNAKTIEPIKDYLAAIDNVPVPKPTDVFHLEKVGMHPIENGVVHRIQNNLPIDKIIDNHRRVWACGEPELVTGQVGKALRSDQETDIVFIKDLANFELHEPYSAGAWISVESDGTIQSIMGNSGALGNGWRGWDFYLDTLNRLSLRLVNMLPHNFLGVTSDQSVPLDKWTHVFFTYDGSGLASGVQLFVNGRRMKKVVEKDALQGTIKRRWRSRPFWKNRPLMVFRSGRYHTGENGVFKGSADELRFYDRELSSLEVLKIYEQESGAKSSLTDEELQIYFVDHELIRSNGLHQRLNVKMRKLLADRVMILKDVLDIMIMDEGSQARKSFVLNRGQYDEPTDEVFAQTPEVIGTMPENLPRNRLGLAQWMITPDHPLTARVAVNRYWQMIFGQGIVETPHDFGTQGKLPSHPKLLDFLAVDFIESGWDIRALLKKMVMSHTYRQNSNITPEAATKDPRNQYLSHAPNYRLQAEVIRDKALAVSGLLQNKIGGPSVMPYQPEGVWSYGSLVSGDYEVDTTDDRFRRSMYTYVRRTTPHPAMIAFDAPDRLVCTVKRENTNTPLQALVLLNDPQFVEAACHLAFLMDQAPEGDLKSKLKFGFRSLCGRQATDQELRTLLEHHRSAQNRFRKDPKSAREMLASHKTKLKGKDPIEMASLAIVANTVMSFDEFYMKR